MMQHSYPPDDPLLLKSFYQRLLQNLYYRTWSLSEAQLALEQKLIETKILFKDLLLKTDSVSLLEPYLKFQVLLNYPDLIERLDWHYTQWLEENKTNLSTDQSTSQIHATLINCVGSDFVHLFMHTLEHSSSAISVELQPSFFNDLIQSTCRIHHPNLAFLSLLHEKHPEGFTQPSTQYHKKYPIHHLAKQGYLKGLQFFYQHRLAMDQVDARGQDMESYLTVYHPDIKPIWKAWVAEQRQHHFQLHWPEPEPEVSKPSKRL